MKAKLIKTEVNYILEDDKGVVIASTSLNKEGLSLSIKNCQAIELGYDLEQVCWELFGGSFEKRNVESEEEADKVVSFGIECFQKALELMGDKKFSEEDVMLGWDAGVMSKSIVFSMEQLEPHRESYQRNLKPASLQQTEWDVEIEIEVVPDFYSRSDKDGSIFTSNKKEIPKLDSTGCLILKRM